MSVAQEIQIFSGPFFVVGMDGVGKEHLIYALSPTRQIIATDRRYPVEITSFLQIASPEQLPANPFGIILTYNIVDIASFTYIYQILPTLPETPVMFLIGTHRDYNYQRYVSFDLAQKYKKDNALLWFEVSSLEEKEIDILRKQIFIRSVFAVRNLVEIDAPIPVKAPNESTSFPELCFVREQTDIPDVNVYNIHYGSLLAAPYGAQVLAPSSYLIDSIPDFQQYEAQVERAQNLAYYAQYAEDNSEEYYYDDYYSDEDAQNTEKTQSTNRTVKQITISPKAKQRSYVNRSAEQQTEYQVPQISEKNYQLRMPPPFPSALTMGDYFSVYAQLPPPLKARGSRLHKANGDQEIERSRFSVYRDMYNFSKSRLYPAYYPVMQKSIQPVKASRDKINKFYPKTVRDPNTTNGYWESQLCPSRTKNEVDVSKIPHIPGEIAAESKYPHGDTSYGEAVMSKRYEEIERKSKSGLSRSMKSSIFNYPALEIDLEIGGKTLLLVVNRDDNAYEVSKQFCLDNYLDYYYIKKLALLILDRLQKLASEEKNVYLQRKRERYETYRFYEPTFRNLVMRKILFKFELTVAGRSITVAWREGDVERVIAQHVLKTLSLKEEEYMGFVLGKINEVVSLWKLGQQEYALETYEVY